MLINKKLKSKPAQEEMRHSARPGWINMGNNDLQVLCDPPVVSSVQGARGETQNEESLH